ncbi:hypothetical protein ACFX16_005793 [Malus domestica]
MKQTIISIHDPFIFPDTYSSTIPNLPSSTLNDDSLTLKKTTPSLFVTDRASTFGKYRPFKTLAQKDSDSWVRRQNCFASKALLKSEKLLKPRPPTAFGRQMVSQLLQWI